MNKFLIGFLTALVVITIVGCSSILKSNEGVFGKAQKADDALDAKIRLVENAQAQKNEERLSHIGAWSKGGVEHSLAKVTNAPPEVVVAKEMNERVEALAGNPDFKEVQAIEVIVDNLLSKVDATKLAGEKALAVKDKEINKLQTTIKQLDSQREDEIAKAFAQADLNAQKADQYQATLNQMDKFFGLGAVFYGLKRFVVSSMWVLGIGSVLFLILRVFASSNPIAGAVFEIFSRVGSWVINIVEMVLPKAAEKAGHIAIKIADGYKSALTKVVDGIQMAKSKATAAGKPASLQDALDEAEKTMTAEEKDIIEELKKALNWK
jgi:hypothetical protein